MCINRFRVRERKYVLSSGARKDICSAVELCEAGVLHSWRQGQESTKTSIMTSLYMRFSLLPPGPWGQDVICKGQNEKLLGFQRMTLT